MIYPWNRRSHMIRCCTLKGSRINVKVKCTLVQTLKLCAGRTDHRGSRGIALSFHDHDTRRGWGVSVTLRPLFTPGKVPVPIVQEVDGPQGRSGQVRKISPPPGFDPSTVQHVASRYTYYATQPTMKLSRRTYFSICIAATHFPIETYFQYSGEINPTRCNNCVFYSQWLYSTCFGWQSHPSSGVQCCIWPQVSWLT